MEFQAVVLALGVGSRMTDLTTHCSKAFLPVANYPLVWYPLRSLEDAGFEEAIVVTSEALKTRMQKEVATKLNSLRLDIVVVNDEESGTAETFCQIADKIHRDVLVISCDLVMNTDLHDFVELHRLRNASLTALFAPIVPEMRIAAPGSKNKTTIERDFVGLDPKTSQLICIFSEADLSDTLNVKNNILEKHPNFTLHSQLMDAHLYLMKRWVLDYLIKEKSFSSIKGEVIPHLVHKQFENSSMDGSDEHTTSSDKSSFVGLDKTLQLIEETSSWMKSVDDVFDGRASAVRCYGSVAKGFCIRSNTMASYFEANRMMLLQTRKEGMQVKIDPTAQRENARIDNSSAIGANTTIEGKSFVRTSAIGDRCRIGDKVQLTNCLIMNDVTVEEGCVLERCIVGDGASIGAKSKLKDCLVAARVTVCQSAKLTKELVADAHQMMEIE